MNSLPSSALWLPAVYFNYIDTEGPQPNPFFPTPFSGCGSLHWSGSQKMVPLAPGADLNLVGGEGPLAAPNSRHVAVGHDASPCRRKPRTKHIDDLDDVFVFTDRTGATRRVTTLARIAHQFALRIADFAAGRFPGLEGKDGAVACQAIVDRPAGSISRGSWRTLRHIANGTGQPFGLLRVSRLAARNVGHASQQIRFTEMATFTRYTTAGEYGQRRPTNHVELGPGDVGGLDRKLLGDVDGLRVLDLGCGSGHSAVALAIQGARVVAIDADEEEVATTRAAAERNEVHVEVHHGDLADLAFLPADAFDAVIAVHSLAAVSDIGRVFRQTHRLLKTDKPIVCTLPHPAQLMVTTDAPRTIASDYADPAPLGEGHYLTHRHGVGHVFTQLHRANYRVDNLIEPDGNGAHPASVIFRARKIGN